MYQRLARGHLVGVSDAGRAVGAVTAGMLAVLWMGRKVSGRAALVGSTVAIAEVLLSHTRTALVGLVAGLIVAGLSLSNARVRRFFTTAAVIIAVAVVVAASAIASWLARGEGTAGLLTLTGRDQLLVGGAQHATHAVPGDLRVRDIQRERQRLAHRQ